MVSVGDLAKETIRFSRYVVHSLSARPNLKYGTLIVKLRLFSGVWFRATIVSQVKDLCGVQKHEG